MKKLTVEDINKILEIDKNPPAPNFKLRAARERYLKTIKDGRYTPTDVSVDKNGKTVIKQDGKIIGKQG